MRTWGTRLAGIVALLSADAGSAAAQDSGTVPGCYLIEVEDATYAPVVPPVIRLDTILEGENAMARVGLAPAFWWRTETDSIVVDWRVPFIGAGTTLSFNLAAASVSGVAWTDTHRWVDAPERPRPRYNLQGSRIDCGDIVAEPRPAYADTLGFWRAAIDFARLEQQRIVEVQNRPTDPLTGPYAVPAFSAAVSQIADSLGIAVVPDSAPAPACPEEDVDVANSGYRLVLQEPVLGPFGTHDMLVEWVCSSGTGGLQGVRRRYALRLDSVWRAEMWDPWRSRR